MTEHKVGQLETRVGELLGRQSATRDARDFEQLYGADPVGFAKEVLKVDLWSGQPGQREVVESVRDFAFTACAGCNAAGKDTALAVVALWWAYCRGGLALLVSASQRQTQEVLMRGEVARLFRAGRLPGDLYVERLELADERTGILAFTTSDMSKLGGFHDASVLVGISEAQGVPDWGFEALMGCAVEADDRVVAVGNALTSEGQFFRAFRPDSPWHTLRIPAKAHPNIAGGPHIASGPTVAWVERMAAEFGASSPAYLSRVHALFPVDATDALVARAWVERAAARWQARAPFDPSRASVVGLDVARLGGASCALAVRQGETLHEVVTWSNTDAVETERRVLAELDRLGIGPTRRAATPERLQRLLPPPLVVIDEVGIGGPILDHLRAAGCSVLGYNAGRTPSAEGRGKFVNSRAESAWRVRELLQQDAIALPPDARLADELCSMKYRTEPTTSRLALEPKPELAARLGRSPDAMDAAVMAFSVELLRPCTTGGGFVQVL